jgi:hypothetical protein
MCGCGLQVFDLREAKIEVNAGTDSRESCLRSKEALAKHEKFLEEMAKKDGVPEKEFPEALGKLPEK